jgi:hypothetical protein
MWQVPVRDTISGMRITRSRLINAIDSGERSPFISKESRFVLRRLLGDLAYVIDGPNGVEPIRVVEITYD